MAATFSFDIVSEYNLAEVINAVDQTKREIGTRFDMKGTNADVEFRDSDKTGLTVTGDNEYHVDAILDILRKKLAGRSVSQKILDTSKEPTTSNMKVTRNVAFRKGLDQDKAKKITALIRQDLPKVKTQIQGDTVRVTGSKKDELQAAMRLLEEQDFDFPLSYTNYR
ncbi:MAG TPA: YajQ family cyclic di-GMP-binding protein [Candidatus Saccharimonadales bacterium]|nr:YajQ family cyclic di-GMP-binding protein [Candidatus Saccharimonadales bacterium]